MPNKRTRQKKKEAAAAAAEGEEGSREAQGRGGPPPAPTPPGGRQRGVCRWFVDKKKYGFISSGDGPRHFCAQGRPQRRPLRKATRSSMLLWISKEDPKLLKSPK